MDSGSSRWVGNLVLAGAIVIVVGLLVYVTRPQPEKGTAAGLVQSKPAATTTRRSASVAGRYGAGRSGDNTPAEIVRAYVKTLYVDRDVEAALGFFHFPNDLARRAAEQALRMTCVTLRFTKDAEALRNQAGPMQALAGEAEIARLVDEETLPLTMVGRNAARVTLPGGTIDLILIRGEWRIDFEKWRRSMGVQASEEFVSTTARTADMFEKLADDIEAGRISTFEMLQNESQLRTHDMAVAQAKATLRRLATALELFDMDMGRYPTQEEGLSVLARRPADASNWNGPYLPDVPPDPWGGSYAYQLRAGGSASDTPYNVVSPGPDQRLGSADDIDLNTNLREQ